LAFYPDHNHIVIANAGSHQIWSYDRKEEEVSLLAGNGREDIVDGALPFNSLAQTSGLSPVGDKLYFVDAETSSLRVYHDKTVDTLVGTGLFDFGLKDGKKDVALLQHPLGLYAEDDKIYVADTYNHKIRLYKDGQLSTLRMDELNEPNAILKIDDLLYISDTNNHRIVMMDEEGHNKGVLDVMPMDKPVAFNEKLPNPLYVRERDVATETKVQFDLPKGWHVNPDAPSYMAVFDDSRTAIAQFKKDDIKTGKLTLPVLQADKNYTLQGVVYYCQNKVGSQCLIRGLQADLHVADKPMDTSAITFVLPPSPK
jgi:hypothetical protein